MTEEEIKSLIELNPYFRNKIVAQLFDPIIADRAHNVDFDYDAIEYDCIEVAVKIIEIYEQIKESRSGLQNGKGSKP